MKILMLFMFIITVGLSCNRGGGYRQNQEEATRPTDYTTGKDVKEVPTAPAERAPDERRETPSQSE